MTIEDSARLLESEGVPPEMIYDNYEPQQSGFGISSLVPLSIGPFPTGVLQSLISAYGPEFLRRTGVIKEDGSVDYTQAALLGSMAIPGTVVARGGLGLGKAIGSRLISRFRPQIEAAKEAAKKGIITRFTKPDVKGPVKIKRVKPKVSERKDGKIGAETPTSPGGAAQRIFPRGLRARSLNIPKILRDSALFGSLFTLGSTGISRMIQNQAEKDAKQARIDEVNRLLAEEKEKEEEEKRLADEAARLAEIEAEKNRLLAEEKKRRGSDLLIGLGGAIASARNLGELGSGISDTYFKLKSAEEGSETKALQAELLKAQVANIEANIGSMELRQLQSSASIIQEGIETGALDRTEHEPTLQAIVARILLLQNLEASGLNQSNDIYGKTGSYITGG